MLGNQSKSLIFCLIRREMYVNWRLKKLYDIDTHFFRQQIHNSLIFQGIGDTRGTAQDNTDILEIIKCISQFKELHGICILLKPNEARLDTTLFYCLNQLFLHLHRNAVQNIIFCLIHVWHRLSRDRQYRLNVCFMEIGVEIWYGQNYLRKIMAFCNGFWLN